MRRILIATDDSPLAQDAVDIGLELAEEQDAEVMFIHVLAPENRSSDLPSEDQAVLSEAAQLAEARGVKCKLELCSGAAPERILHAADEFDADLVVVGSRGILPWRSALRGSVSREVTSSREPVLFDSTGRKTMLREGLRKRGKGNGFCGNTRDAVATGVGRRGRARSGGSGLGCGGLVDLGHS